MLRGRGDRCALATLALALGASAAWLVVPAYSGGGCTSVFSHDASVMRCFRLASVTLAQENGVGRVLVLLAIPVAIALLGLIRRFALRTLTAALLTVFAVISGFSIGFLYLPAVLLAILAASRTPRGGRPSRFPRALRFGR